MFYDYFLLISTHLFGIIWAKKGGFRLENYILNKDTLALVALDSKTSMIIEKNKDFFVNMFWKDIINNSCLYYGSSYDGRVEGSKALLKRDYKLPIIVSEFYDILFFPITGKEDICTWLSLNNLESYDFEGDRVEFIFKCGKSYNIMVGRRSFESQLLKAYDLNMIIKNRYKNS